MHPCVNETAAAVFAAVVSFNRFSLPQNSLAVCYSFSVTMAWCVQCCLFHNKTIFLTLLARPCGVNLAQRESLSYQIPEKNQRYAITQGPVIPCVPARCLLTVASCTFTPCDSAHRIKSRADFPVTSNFVFSSRLVILNTN